VFRQIFFGDLHDFGGNHFAFQVPWFSNLRVFRRSQHPAHARQPLLRINQFRQLLDIRFRLHYPIVSRDSSVQCACFHVARHFLRAHHQAFNLWIIYSWHVTARAQRDFPARVRKQIQCRFLQASFWDSQLQQTHRLFSDP
jgi:hypothetical protein